MLELIRCPSCRGRKQVEKLGGVLGDCNTCKGEGKIKGIDRPLPPMSNHDAVYGKAKDAIIEATSRAVPSQVDPLESETVVKGIDSPKMSEAFNDVTRPVKKRAVFKRNKE